MAEGFSGKPKSIKEAMRSGDTEALRAAGRKGAEVANERREQKADIEETFARLASEQAEEEERALRRSTNEDVLTADGEDVSFIAKDTNAEEEGFMNDQK